MSRRPKNSSWILEVTAFYKQVKNMWMVSPLSGSWAPLFLICPGQSTSEPWWRGLSSGCISSTSWGGVTWTRGWRWTSTAALWRVHSHTSWVCGTQAPQTERMWRVSSSPLTPYQNQAVKRTTTTLNNPIHLPITCLTWCPQEAATGRSGHTPSDLQTASSSESYGC